ncbi:MAG: hypothetical protein JRN26_02585 [Nitrososphaerota archaeon]|jgi:chromatin segregation and condensation protein Rec8/ScpA/Scc1 (kleisin family)|nr:hypothetical protein [Nitrososphaerota archaeon]MDG6927328.1 hypothetical protein [Nitrososphaerota archaeon]MDG6930944.1 hypothetical protein [Nitrososphaerota archaeon]MDG6932244.1 hypothetical protein [Nitrososphaerota archaeon]MDG6935763.1 hypothetical protein [Nitrososphaerota archaeon]
MEEERDKALRILLNPDSLHRYDPWDLKVYALLEIFRDYATKMQMVDFRLSGVAVSTSSIIYKLKAGRIFYKVRESRPEVPLLEGPAIDIQPSYPVELSAGDVDELMEAFREMVSQLLSQKGMEGPKSIEPIDAPIISETLMLEELMNYKKTILERLKGGSMAFYELVRGMDAIDVVRMFLSLLLLAHEGSICVNSELMLELPNQGCADF